MGSFAGNALAAGTGTARFFFGPFFMLYSMFFFLINCGRILQKTQDCIPFSTKGIRIIGIVIGPVLAALFVTIWDV